ncbi:MAG: XylR N-terminal domain-containing protein [Proteobacteria bacterium]|nr:XylR N-terminal domain-containing protein [Pseudomonadota bacterium]
MTATSPPSPGQAPIRFAQLADLLGRLHISTTDGRIWLDEQRMLLLHASALGALRQDMVESLGTDIARRLFTRLGYQAGRFGAQMARKARPCASLNDLFVIGPQWHCLEGIGLAGPVRLVFDADKGEHYGEWVWRQPPEDDAPLRQSAPGATTPCWMQVGYASGFATEWLGRPILYREVACQAMGQPACHLIGKPVEAWGRDAADDWQYLMVATLHGPPRADGEVERVSRTLDSLLHGGDEPTQRASLDEVETLLLKKALARAQGNIAAAARLLGITRPQMVYRLKSRGINTPAARP